MYIIYNLVPVASPPLSRVGCNTTSRFLAGDFPPLDEQKEELLL
jgi:hypothetical protein